MTFSRAGAVAILLAGAFGAFPALSAELSPAVAAPQARARALALRFPLVQRARREVARAAQEINEPALRATVQTQLQLANLPPDAWAFQHREQAQTMLRGLGLLGAQEALPLPSGVGGFDSAPGGPCGTAHHGYPGGLLVHSEANLLHARAFARTYKQVYGVTLRDDWLVAAALWHDSLKAQTLPFLADGSCGPEARLASDAAHHALGVAAALLRHLPTPLVWTIAATHRVPGTDWMAMTCGYLRAAGLIAYGDPKAVPCPQLDPKSLPLEAFASAQADSDWTLTVSVQAWYGAHAPSGWERYDALIADGGDVAAWARAAESGQ